MKPDAKITALAPWLHFASHPVKSGTPSVNSASPKHANLDERSAMSEGNSTAPAREVKASLDIVLALISEGMFSVDGNGAVWRHKIRTKHGYRNVAPRRADHVLPIGYRYVSVTIDRKQFSVPAHCVVWSVLKGSIPTGMEINHKNGNRANNLPDNLELATSSENKKHSYDFLNHARRGSPKHSAEDRARVIQLRSSGMSYRAIERETGVSAASARQIAKAAG